MNYRSHWHLLFIASCVTAGGLLSAPSAHGTTSPQTNPVFIDASAPTAPPQSVQAALGTSTSANGNTLSVNSQYLLLNNKPWLPVMGEFHYSRVPEAQWEEEILKMKAARVEIIATYVIWIHHEEIEGQFDWTGQRDLRRFVQLCGKHGMYVYPRLGPWAHGEVRNGGLPDWVLKHSPVRRNDPTYLAEVATLYDQIGGQLRGLLWKDNGPVIGIQLENEYRGEGPGSGSDHIRQLKKLALNAGLDVPLYTVTGWDGAAIPLDQVLPVYGGYPDAPWIRHPGRLPVNEVFSFRFANRAAGSMGAIGSHGQNDAAAYRGTPFLTAEIGGGMQDTYYRRPVIHPDDIASLGPVMLGSGANLLGYYMFQGGRNPDGKLTTLQESQRTGYPTDVPIKSYDFQGPLSEFGQERELFRRMKLLNYFLNDFGAILAPMKVDAPTVLPKTPGDLSVARVAARTLGDRGFVFFNNFVRGASMPTRKAFQIHLKLASGELLIPDRTVDLPTGAYGIWPVNFDLGGIRLIYSTAQLFKLAQTGGDSYYFFFTVPGITPEFALKGDRKFLTVDGAAGASVRDGVTYLRMGQPSAIQQVALAAPQTTVHIVLMSRDAAEQLWIMDGSNSLVKTTAQVFSDHDRLYLRSVRDPSFTFGIFGAHTPRGLRGTRSGLFTEYSLHVPPVTMEASARQIPSKPAGHSSQAALAASASSEVPFAPEEKDFDDDAVWKLDIADTRSANISNAYLRITYTGDVARLYAGDKLLDDNFWNGQPWQVGLNHWQDILKSSSLQLHILPSFGDRVIGDLGEGSEPERRKARLIRTELLPEYQTVIDFNP